MSLDSFRDNIEKGVLSSDFSRDNVVMAWFLSAFTRKMSVSDSL
jgi:hypothetical protein